MAYLMRLFFQLFSTRTPIVEPIRTRITYLVRWEHMDGDEVAAITESDPQKDLAVAKAMIEHSEILGRLRGKLVRRETKDYLI